MTNDWDSTFADADKIDGIAASSSPRLPSLLFVTRTALVCFIFIFMHDEQICLKPRRSILA